MTQASSAPKTSSTTGSPSAADGQRHVHELLKELDNVMLITYVDGPLGPSASRIHARPMAVAKLEEDSTMWFVTAIDSPKVAEAESPPLGHIVAQTSTRYLSLSGTLTVTRDRKKIEEVWSKANEVWFPEGPSDPRVCLLGFTPSEAEFWDVSGAKGVKYALRAAKALLTGEAIEANTEHDKEQHDKVKMTS